MTTFPTATRHADRIELAFPFEQALVDGLRSFPAHARSYNPATRVWTVRAPHDERALALFFRFFPGAVVFGERSRHSAPPPPSTLPSAPGPHATLHVLPSAPREVIDAAYRALVKQHHPDRLPAPERAGGNAALARINVAYAQLTGGQR